MADKSAMLRCEIGKAGSAELISASQQQQLVVTDDVSTGRARGWCNSRQVVGKQWAKVWTSIVFTELSRARQGKTRQDKTRQGRAMVQ